jgi:apolipoprotein N-acyltransferase
MTRLPVRQSVLPALLSGGLLCLGLPGTGGLWPLLFVALVPFLTALRTAPRVQAAWCGLFTGLVHFLSLLYWIVIVMGRYGKLPWYISVTTLVLLALVLSLFVVVFALFARWFLVKSTPFAALWALPCLWVGLDWIRSFLFTGFPWMDLGYGLWNVPMLIQFSDITGHYGITFLLLLTNTLAALLLTDRVKTVRLHILAPVILLLIGVAGYSAWRWQSLERWMKTAVTMPVGVVQGNVEQDKKWVPEEREKTVMDYIGKTVLLFSGKKPALVVWPETALPFFPEAHPLTAPLRSLTMENNIALLTGAPWYTVVDREKRKYRYYNSALLLGSDGYFGGRYSKTHLVPFGEYVPMKKYLPFIAPIVQTVGDFTPGTIENPITYLQAKIGVLLCYESIFPDIAEKWVRAGANILINLTNDAWYGKSSAPQQSFAMTVFRAVETRRSVVRAANTGISGFIDPLGRVRMKSEIFVSWEASDDVVLNKEVPFVVPYGHLFAPLCLVLGLGQPLYRVLRRRLGSGPLPQARDHGM